MIVLPVRRTVRRAAAAAAPALLVGIAVLQKANGLYSHYVKLKPLYSWTSSHYGKEREGNKTSKTGKRWSWPPSTAYPLSEVRK